MQLEPTIIVSKNKFKVFLTEDTSSDSEKMDNNYKTYTKGLNSFEKRPVLYCSAKTRSEARITQQTKKNYVKRKSMSTAALSERLHKPKAQELSHISCKKQLAKVIQAAQAEAFFAATEIFGNLQISEQASDFFWPDSPFENLEEGVALLQVPPKPGATIKSLDIANISNFVPFSAYQAASILINTSNSPKRWGKMLDAAFVKIRDLKYWWYFWFS